MVYMHIKILAYYISSTIDVWPEDDIVMSKHVAMSVKTKRMIFEKANCCVDSSNNI
jgi:hypothetical protein